MEYTPSQQAYDSFYNNKNNANYENVFRGALSMRGYGFGNTLMTLGKYILPLLKPVLQVLKKRGLQAGGTLATNIITGTPLKQAMKQQFTNTKQGIKTDFKKLIFGKPAPSNRQGVKKKKTLRRKLIKYQTVGRVTSTPGKKRKLQDIFS